MVAGWNDGDGPHIFHSRRSPPRLVATRTSRWQPETPTALSLNRASHQTGLQCYTTPRTVSSHLHIVSPSQIELITRLVFATSLPPRVLLPYRLSLRSQPRADRRQVDQKPDGRRTRLSLVEIMTDQVAAKKILNELSKREDLKNKVCNDCSNPNPQWASLSFAVFLCLQCAGTHRGFGVHISFVRSVSMDTWQDEQIRRMQLGGNAPFQEFMKSYCPAEQGGYREGLSPYDKYHCWAATQYREKLDAALAGKEWAPSPPPAGAGLNNRSSSPSARPSSAQGLRKSRASTRSATANSLRSDSPSPFRNSPRGTPDPANDQKTANENYFASLGKLNESRPADLPPSQGGRYTGFGSTPTPPAPNHPSYGLSSHAAPTLNDLQQNPLGALSKGWSLFSAAVVGAGKAVTENVIQPGVEKVTDPNFQASVKGYMTEAQKRAAAVGGTANQWSKQQLGIDVADSVGGVVGTVKDKVLGGPQRNGYGAIALEHDGESSALYQDGDDDDFGEYGRHQSGISPLQASSTQPPAAPAAQAKKSNWDEEWQDF
ncbi:putative arfGap-domain-containing protein [Lyophyllum shimeji]|uniref:ArfGap-domain-containing protein n=1 Tax=Lyophyllum shimeji TaxID=47721 RepID=A0A9P3UID6_LYOSH|nr:putative arfGap-domain-containing protein [Lyophyllum shimeji]